MSSIVSSASVWLTRMRDDLQGVHRATIYAALGAGTLLVVYIARRSRRNYNLPPCPSTSKLFRRDQVDIVKLDELVKQCGPILNFRIFTLNLLFLCDADSIRDASLCHGDAMSGRLRSNLFRYIDKDCGIVFIDGPKWQEHRRFVLSVLRSFGFGKNITERITQEELVSLRDELAKLAGTPVFPRMKLIKSVSNVICHLMFGQRSAAEDDFDRMIRATIDAISSNIFNDLFMATFFRLILLIPGDFFGLKKFFADIDEMNEYIHRKIAEHRNTTDWVNERDLIDAYLIEMRKREQENPGKHTFTDFQLNRIIVELFIAGMETTSNSITWALYLVTKHPHIQARVQAEIDSVIGDKLPQIADRAKLVYTTAVLYEVSRFASVVPFSVPHRVTEDMEVRGYFIPKNTIVLPYLFGAHRDKRIWKNPSQFDPTHFYDESSNSLVNQQDLLTFGVGKRACLGESLATQELFVFFTGLLQRFRFEEDAEHPLPEVQDQYMNMSFRHAPEYKVVISERKSASNQRVIQ